MYVYNILRERVCVCVCVCGWWTACLVATFFFLFSFFFLLIFLVSFPFPYAPALCVYIRGTRYIHKPWYNLHRTSLALSPDVIIRFRLGYSWNFKSGVITNDTHARWLAFSLSLYISDLLYISRVSNIRALCVCVCEIFAPKRVAHTHTRIYTHH